MAKVLLVEDDNNLREIYEARLQAEGYETVTASDGEQALVIAKDAKPDLIISDVMMPKISGFEMLDILRNTDGLKDVKVIMLTALGQSEDKTRADQLGADKYLVKSQVTLEDIVKTAHQLLDDSAAIDPVAVVDATPIAATEPVAVSAPATDSAAEETKAIQAQVDSFEEVAPAPAVDPVAVVDTQVDPAPAAEVTPEPAAVTPTPEVPSAEETTEAHDDAVMATAIDSINTNPEAQKPSDVTAVEVAPPEPTPITASAPPVTETEDAESDGVTIGHKKIIAPISDAVAKPDINQLLAAEEAASTANEPVPVVPATTTVAPTPENTTGPTADPTKPNPNDIAL